MSDVPCRVCGEPWDAYGVEHGDMTAAEALLFRKGAGCPACKGKQPAAITAALAEDDADEWEDPAYRHARAIMVEAAWDDDSDYPGVYDACEGLPAPDYDLDAAEDEVTVVLWTCKGCGVQAIRYPASANEHRHGKGEIRWFGGRRMHYRGGNGPMTYSGLYDHQEPDEEGPTYEGLDGCWCPGCVETCDGCGDAPVFTSGLVEDEQTSDVYDAGRSFGSSDYRSTLCLECKLDEEREEQEDEDD